MFGRLMLFLVISTLITLIGQNQTLASTSGVDFRLKGVLISPSSRSALINGRIAREGERVAGVEILAIEEGGVRVLSGSQEYTVLVGSGAWLQPSAVRAARAVHEPESPIRRVQNGDTLSAIAEDYAGNGISLNQAMVALFEANPDAFDGNINRLRAGAVLQVPAREAMRRNTSATAMAKVIHQTESWKADRARPVQVAQAPVPSEYGPVRFGETLSGIAVEVSGDGISMHEMMVALFDANPHAFGDSIDLLHEGAVLRVPDMQARRQYETLAAHTF